MFELRAYGDPAAMAAVSEGLAGLQGVRHLSVAGAGSATAMVTADVRADAADAVLAILERLEAGGASTATRAAIRTSIA